MAKYSELLIEYDIEEDVVYVSGLVDGEFWEEFSTLTPDIADVESFAWGIHDGLKLFHDRMITVVNITDIFADDEEDDD